MLIKNVYLELLLEISMLQLNMDTKNTPFIIILYKNYMK